MRAGAVALPYQPSRPNYNGLNVLAEASRRVGAGVDANAGGHHNGTLDPSIDNDTDGLTFLNLEAMATHPTSELPSIAASAQDILPVHPDLVTPQGSSMPESLFANPSDESYSLSTLPNSQPALRITPTTAPSTHFVSETGTTKPSKPKVRGKFTAERRREVQNVRKIGACLRCRMLRKNCSPGEPCLACAAIGTPRVWKTSCLRTRLANEITLFSVGLHSVLATKEATNIIVATGSMPFRTEVEVSIACGDDIIRLRLNGVASAAPSTEKSNLSAHRFLLETESESTVAEVDKFLTNTPRLFLGLETSSLPRKMIDLAYLQSSTDTILSHVLRLWNTIILLLEPEQSWRLAVGALQIDPVSHPESFSAMTSQLRSLIERHTTELAKNVITEVERRLVRNQREADQQFQTFLIIWILLNCIERMCWIFQKWEYAPPNTWPLERSPKEYATEGDTFTNIIEGLLEIRTYAPKLVLEPQRGILLPRDPSYTKAYEWFAKLAITPEYLTSRQDQLFDPADSRSNDGRYFSRLFRP